jgi:hypothetical protein
MRLKNQRTRKIITKLYVILMIIYQFFYGTIMRVSF